MPQNNKIKIRRGIQINLPLGGTEDGELRYSIDSQKLYIDDGIQNVEIGGNLFNFPISTATQTALNAKQDNITLTTSGTSGAATLVGATLNIPQYQSVITNPITGTGTTNYVSKFTGSGSIGNSLIFDNGTNVGINTTAPVYPASGRTVLSVNGSTSSLLEFQNGGFINGYVYVSSTLYEQSSADAPQAFLTSNSERMRITAGGNIGIRKTNPDVELDVYGQIQMSKTSNASAILGGIASSWGGDVQYPTLYGTSADRWVMHINPHISYVQNGVNGFTGFTEGARVRFASNTAASEYWDIGIGVNSVGTDKYSLGRLGTSFLAVNNSGNIGVNITSPLEKLHVNGNILLPVGNSLFLVPGSTNFGIGTPNSDGVQVFTGIGDYIRFGHMSGVNTFTERMRVASNGNIGIGTSNPVWKFVVSKGGAAGFEIDPDNGSPGYVGVYSYNRASGSYYPLLFQAANYYLTIGSVGIGTTTIDPSAILQLESTTQGFLPPRMEEYQRDAISAAEGLIIFNINTQELNVWAGGSWRKIAYV